MDAHRFMLAFALPSLDDGTKSPIRAVRAGVAIDPKTAWMAINIMSWVAFATKIIGIQSKAIVNVHTIMKGTLRFTLSLNLPQKTCITLLDIFDEDWYHPISADEAPSFTA